MGLIKVSNNTKEAIRVLGVSVFGLLGRQPFYSTIAILALISFNIAVFVEARGRDQNAPMPQINTATSAPAPMAGPTPVMTQTIPAPVTAAQAAPQQQSQTAPQPQGQGAMASQEQSEDADQLALHLIYSALIGLNQANQTQNYSVLRALGSEPFQFANSEARLSEIFSKFRAAGVDLSPVILLEPNLISKPEIDQSGNFRLTGFIPTEPAQVNFDLIYESKGSQWLLSSISVDISEPEKAVEEASPPMAQKLDEQQQSNKLTGLSQYRPQSGQYRPQSGKRYIPKRRGHAKRRFKNYRGPIKPIYAPKNPLSGFASAVKMEQKLNRERLQHQGGSKTIEPGISIKKGASLQLPAKQPATWPVSKAAKDAPGSAHQKTY